MNNDETNKQICLQCGKDRDDETILHRRPGKCEPVASKAVREWSNIQPEKKLCAHCEHWFDIKSHYDGSQGALRESIQEQVRAHDKIASLESSLEELKKRNVELQETVEAFDKSNMGFVKQIMELESKLKTADDKLAAQYDICKSHECVCCNLNAFKDESE